MDLLGSILDKMEKPPVIKKNEKQQEMIKKQQETIKKIEEAEKQKMRKFKQDIQNKLESLAKDDSGQKIEFEPMEKFFRSIVHGVAEDLELRGISFGIDGIDRHVIVYKPEFFPSDEEISCLKRNVEYDPEKEKLRKEEEEKSQDCSSKKKKFVSLSNYQDKYKHLIGSEVGKSAAQATTVNSKFGCVPSSNKRDQRSIEQTLADIKKKKQKTTKDDTQ